jgi:hypothetical protein
VIGQVLAETRLTGALGSDTSSCSSTKACPSADKFARWRVKPATSMQLLRRC